MCILLITWVLWKMIKKQGQLWKLRPLISSLRNNFLEVTPEEYHAVDEIMVPFKGQSIIQQYMPNKPHKWDFKIWGRSGTSGKILILIFT